MSNYFIYVLHELVLQIFIILSTFRKLILRKIEKKVLIFYELIVLIFFLFSISTIS